MNLRIPAASLALLAPVVLATVTGCGGNTASSGDAATSSSTSSSSASSATSFDDYQLAFASCMREQGVDLPDPGGDGTQLDVGGDVEAFQVAAEVCQDELGQPPAAEGGGSGPSDAELQAQNLEIATCLREKGVDVADPQPGVALEVPSDTASDVVAACAPHGIMGRTSGGGR